MQVRRWRLVGELRVGVGAAEPGIREQGPDLVYPVTSQATPPAGVRTGVIGALARKVRKSGARFRTSGRADPS